MPKVPPVTLAFAALLLAGEAAAQQRRLTVEDIYDPDKKHEVGGVPPVTLSWIDDRHYHWPKPGDRRGTTEHLKVEALTGRTEPLFDAGRLRAALERVDGVTSDQARTLAEQATYVMDDRRTALVLLAAGDLHLFEFTSATLRRLTSAAGSEEEPGFSPDGAHIAFVRGGNLHVVSRDGAGERALTSDGGPDVLNGKLDWVYQEEIYGRGKFKGYWWSPDSKSLAFLQLREARVPTFPVVDDISYQPVLELERYPKAGDPNPEVRLGVVAAAAGPPRWVDFSRWSAEEPLVVAVGWTPDAQRVVFQVQDRIQTWLDLVFADRNALEVKVALRETTRAWVEPQENGLQFLKDGSFLWLSERTGWKHVYRYRADGTLTGPVTQGEWEARTLHGADPARGWIYFTGTERTPIAEDVYRIRLDGSGLERLSRSAGHHVAVFNPSFALYIDTRSDAVTPPQVRLHGPDGAEVRTINANPMPALRPFGLVKPEFLKVPTRDGFLMEAMLLKPPDFDPAKRYPVYQHTYGGPHAPQVKDKWDSNTSLFHQMLAQRGIVVWVCDNRTASGKGAVSAWPLYKNFGETELRDVEDGLDWLTRHPWVDASRIGINGWSYGGFMVTYAMTHSRRFAMGIAGAPVTDWRDYDSVYTERHMDLPKNNPEGYRKSSPRTAAAKLSGRLLLIHGTYDDNVHPQNTSQFAYELQKAGRPFRLMTYARQRHSFTDTDLVQHLRSMMLAWIEETLLGTPAHAWPLDKAPAVTSPSSGTGSGGRSSRRRPTSGSHPPISDRTRPAASRP